MDDFISYRRYTEEHSMSQADLLFPILEQQLKTSLHFLIFIKKPVVQTIPHILEDTRDFLSRLSYLQNIQENAILVSFDVVELYPNIPYEEGIDIMGTSLHDRSDKSISTESLCRVAKIVLKENYFELGDKILLGTAIGTKFVPNYVNIFMTGLKRKLFANNKFNPFLWLRFLDDIFCIWTDGEEKLNEFFEYLNEFYPAIKFTMEKSFNKINFLDVSVSKNNNKLSTELYTKEMATHQYLHAKSCHRNCIKRAIPYGQAVRIKLICSDENVLNERLTQLETWLLKRGYLQENVRSEIERVNLTSREDLLKKSEKNIDELVTLMLTFHPALNCVHAILRKAHRHVLKSNRLSRVLPSPPRVAFRYAKSLKDRLVKT